MGKKRNGNGKRNKYEVEEQKSRRVEKEHKHPKAQLVCTKILKPKTMGQGQYTKAMDSSIITFGIGPAGTGKTVLAVYYAIQQVFLGNKKKIVITRPIVEAGENLGFLPGDLTEKVDPYIRPIMDALRHIIGEESKALEWIGEHLEIAPLAFMRGRTFDDSILILDEGQNATRDQMFMFLTRLGDNTKAVITADLSQIDLKYKKDSGIFEALKALDRAPHVTIVTFEEEDIIRSLIVATIVNAYKNLREGVRVYADNDRTAQAVQEQSTC